MNNAPDYRMTPQECKQYAMQLVSKAWTLPEHTVREDRANMLAEAQIWATLATVPEPPEEEITDLDPVVGQLLLQQPELPNLICPHGYAARLSRNTAALGERPMLKYSWTDCEICP